MKLRNGYGEDVGKRLE